MDLAGIVSQIPDDVLVALWPRIGPTPVEKMLELKHRAEAGTLDPLQALQELGISGWDLLGIGLSMAGRKFGEPAGPVRPGSVVPYQPAPARSDILSTFLRNLIMPAGR